jgi:hypothetical protein
MEPHTVPTGEVDVREPARGQERITVRSVKYAVEFLKAGGPHALRLTPHGKVELCEG